MNISNFFSASLHGPVDRNHVFTPSLIHDAFSLWKRKGIQIFRDLFVNDAFASFSTLVSKFSPPLSHLFRYFQVRHYVSSHFPSFPALPLKQPWEDMPTLLPRQRAISYIHSLILSLNPSSTNNTKMLGHWSLGLTSLRNGGIRQLLGCVIFPPVPD